MPRQDYTVGWICAVQTEFVAACALLDEEHLSLPTESFHDNNAYTLGRIGDHHIVIACLPKGRYGIASAASVAKDMLRSFESIRFGLMVGIGGGAPSNKHDIRLGDIVVGCPVKKEGGIIPYNFGKAVQDQEFERTGSLNSPPTVLLTALTKLSADHERKGNHIAESVRSIITKNLRMRNKYQNPGVEHDRLYVSSYTHRGGDDKCEKCCDSTTPPQRDRKRRELDPDEPVVHYGLIASADRLMKDAIVRDRLTEDHDILCFEMEAAGLMNDFPCVVIRGICDYSDSHKNDAWQGYAAVTAASYAKELLNVIAKHDVAHTQKASAEMVNIEFSVPFPKDDYFIDRKDIFSQIEGQLQVHHRVSLCGLGGVGKSQIAIEYAHRFQQSHPQSHVFWVYAASYATFLQACHDIARSLKLPACDEPQTNPCELVSKWLNEDDHSWLVVLDNADNAELFFPSAEPELPRANFTQSQRPLSDYLPSILNPQKSLLVTTRSRHVGQDLAHGESCVEVPPLTSQEAMELLQLKLKAAVGSFEKREAKTLLHVLGCNPLAITQAAAFMNRNGMTVQVYLADLERDKQNLADYLSQELQDPRRPRGFPNSVFRTWKLSFDQILKQEPQSAKLLSLMAMLDPQRIPEKLLRLLAEREVEFRMAIGTLDGFALISRETQGEKYAIHPLVQASVHYWLEQRSQKVDCAGQALRLLAKEFPNGFEYEHKEACESMLAHAQAVLCHECTSENDMIQRAALLYKVACFFGLQGRYISAYRAIQESYDIYQERKGDIATDTLNCLDILARCLSDLGKYDAAEKMHRQALEGREKVLGLHNPHTLTTVSNLAIVLEKRGRYKEAEEMHRRALEGSEKVLGIEHPDTLASVNNLASVLENQGSYQEAEEMYRRALEGSEKVLGVEHPDTLTTVSNLAVVLEKRGRYKEAEEIHRRALEGRENILGVEHPSTLKSVNNLAVVLEKQERYKEAKEMHRRALEGSKKVLGIEHPGTLTSVNNLAVVLKSQGSYQEAEEMHRRALEGREKVLGVEYPDTLTSVSNLAIVLEKQGKYQEAEEMLQRALEGSEKVLGVEHPDTLTTVKNLAVLLASQKRYHEASILFQRASAGRFKVLGPDHPATRRCSHSYSAMKRKMQDQGIDIDNLGQGGQADRPARGNTIPSRSRWAALRSLRRAIFPRQSE